MNKNFNKALKKTSAGNYFGYCHGYYIFIFKGMHGGYTARIGRKGKWIWSEGYHGTSLPKLADAKQWAKFRVVPGCKDNYKFNEERHYSYLT